jgi:hypothetical protein
MNERWAPGWLPQGWRRGDRIKAQPPRIGTDQMRLYHDPADWLDRKIGPDDIAILCVSTEEQPAAQAWLEWFFAPPGASLKQKGLA